MADKKHLIYKEDLLDLFTVQAPSMSYNKMFMAVANAPTVDAVEVVPGRWIETLVPDGYVQKASRMRKQCSVCGWTNACRYHYCPNCGAKMDGDGNDI